MKITELKTLENKPYCELHHDGTYLGCFEPMYFIYDDLPRYKADKENISFDSTYSRLLEHFEEIPYHKAAAGDLVIFKIYGKLLHCAVMLDKTNLIHVFKEDKHRIHRLKFLKKSAASFLRRKAGKEQKEGTPISV